MARTFFLPNQPVRFTRNRPYNIKNTKLHIDIDYENKAIKGKVVHTIEPVGKPIDHVELDSAELNISSVMVNRRIVHNHHTFSEKLSIPLDFELKLNESVELSIEYSGHPTRGVYFRGPTKDFPDRKPHVFTHGEAEDSKYYFPCYDYPNMRTATETSLTVPLNWIVVSNGMLVHEAKAEDAGKRTWHFQQLVPHVSYLVSFVAGEYERIEETHDGILLEYVFFPGKSTEAKRSFEKTPKMLDFFGRVTGTKYPYPKYSQIVVSDFLAGGMENISATTLTERTLHDERSHVDFTSDNLVAHELAHQWFGDWITCKNWSHAWLNEGFATYFNALFREFDLGVDDFQYFMYSPTFDSFEDEQTERYQRPIVTDRYWDADELFDSHTYEKGSLVLNALRGMLGDDVFFAGIKNYVAKQQNSIVETSDFRKAMEEVSGVDLEPFFQEWIYSPGFPEYNISYDWNDKEHLLELTVEQTNARNDSVPLYTTPFEIRCCLEDNLTISKTVRMREKVQTFVFSLKGLPKNVNFDPKNWIPKKIRFSKPKEMLLYQLKNDDNTIERVRACAALSEFPTEDVVKALGDSLQGDKFWGVRFESAAALSKIGTEEALEILLSNANSSDPKIRRGVAYALRGFSNLNEALQDQAINALTKFLENDESYYVRGFAAWSLGFYKKKDKPFDAMVRAISQESVNDVVRERAFQGFKERNDPRATPYAIEELARGLWHQGKASAARCLGRIGKSSPEALTSLLAARRDSSHYVRRAAALATGDYGDSSAIPSLDDWLKQEPIGSVRRALRESIFALENKIEEKEKLDKITGDVEKINGELSKLRTKLQESNA